MLRDAGTVVLESAVQLDVMLSMIVGPKRAMPSSSGIGAAASCIFHLLYLTIRQPIQVESWA